ncbi:MAG: hypothetical protein AAB368_06870 [bacterium]
MHCLEYNGTGQVGDGTLVNRTTPARVPFVGVSADPGMGEEHSCAARDTGALLCRGSNANGRLGDGTTTNRPLPVLVQGCSRRGTRGEAPVVPTNTAAVAFAG